MPYEKRFVVRNLKILITDLQLLKIQFLLSSQDFVVLMSTTIKITPWYNAYKL